jgi:hypothetical protein
MIGWEPGGLPPMNDPFPSTLQGEGEARKGRKGIAARGSDPVVQDRPGLPGLSPAGRDSIPAVRNPAEAFLGDIENLNTIGKKSFYTDGCPFF